MLKGRFSEPIGNVEKVWLVMHKLRGQSMMDYEDESYDFKEGVITFQ